MQANCLWVLSHNVLCYATMHFSHFSAAHAAAVVHSKLNRHWSDLDGQVLGLESVLILCTSIAVMYKEMRMHRKHAFFIREAVAICESLERPHQGHALLQLAANAYHVPLPTNQTEKSLRESAKDSLEEKENQGNGKGPCTAHSLLQYSP